MPTGTVRLSEMEPRDDPDPFLETFEQMAAAVTSRDRLPRAQGSPLGD